MRFQAPRGTEDVLPSDSHQWIAIETAFRRIAGLYGYREIRTPTFEDTELFVRSSGETSDIVTKQMYSFEDKGGRKITLKPEGTAPSIRAILEHSLLQQGSALRVSYITPFYRYERPQKGRLREAHQCGLELLGSTSSAADAEIIEATVRFYREIGIDDAIVLLNSLGREEARTRFRASILEHARAFLSGQPEEFRNRTEKNPLRLLDSKDPAAQAAMQGLAPITEFLEPESRIRLDELQKHLSDAGIQFRLAPEIVRGLDYYTETVFEVHSTHLGSQSALCGGGRYDGLVAELGGPPTPAVGVGIGIERALIVLEGLGRLPQPVGPRAFVVAATPSAEDACRQLARRLREHGVETLLDLDGKSLKSQLKAADRSGARYALILGDEELAEGSVTLRNLADSSQSRMPIDQVVEAMSRP